MCIEEYKEAKVKFMIKLGAKLQRFAEILCERERFYEDAKSDDAEEQSFIRRAYLIHDDLYNQYLELFGDYTEYPQ